MKLKKEVWKTIKGFEDYEVSNYGKIKSLKRTMIKKNYNGTLIPIELKERIIVGNNKYMHKAICLKSKLNTLKTSIHREVYKSFIGEIPYKYVINHKDGDKSNNNLYNLECITQSENIKHAYNSGLFTTKEYKKRLIC